MVHSKLASLLLAVLLALPSLPELFQKSKRQFQMSAYREALETLVTLDVESQKPGFERDREALLPGLLFYRGASLAALGRSQEAREVFEQYLTLQPNAQLDPARYPRAVLVAFEEVRRSLDQARREPKTQGSLASAYAAFPRPDAAAWGAIGDEWTEGPVRALLTPEEKRDFERRSDPVERATFVTSFWKSRDPRPETPENEFRDEFEKRVAFADAHFAQDETRGSLTDRGLVFLLFGPPSYSGRKPLQTGDDVADSSGLSQYSRAQVESASRPGGSSTDRMARIAKVTGPGAKIQDAASNWIEVWHYLRQDLPSQIPNNELEFQFVTKVGYGKNVLQRDSQPLAALERARSLARAGRIAVHSPSS
jgi:GWxTD domain-containing protein